MSDIHTRLFLITPVIEDLEAFAPLLEAAFKGGRIDSLWLRLAVMDERALKVAVQRLAALRAGSRRGSPHRSARR